ncbi:MAG: hypothetical protein KDC98_04175 [Planctomycetes bacterium]|nr:hypothetical protein [Planctomycetota bacterium]
MPIPPQQDHPMQIPSLPFVLTLLTFTLPAQGGDGKGEQEPAPKKTQQLDAWPDLEKADSERLLGCLVQFRKDKESLHESARDMLVAIGAAGMPLLFQKVSDRPENINADLFQVFDRVLDERHAALLAREIKKPRVALRRYLVQRLCRFLDPNQRATLTATMKDPDPETAYFAALGALALGEKAAMAPVLAYSKTHWDTTGEITAEVLTKARSREPGLWLFEAIAKAPAADQMAGLRLARYLAIKEQQMILRTYLQAPDHAVKKEAVNALRVINGEDPIEKLSVFQAIEMAKEWLKKV